MAILKIKDSDGNVQEILAIKGDKGDPGEDGTMSFEDLTEEQKASLKGDQGIQGEPGADGYTPVKGTDYWTEADKAEIVADVISALPVYNGEVGE